MSQLSKPGSWPQTEEDDLSDEAVDDLLEDDIGVLQTLDQVAATWIQSIIEKAAEIMVLDRFIPALWAYK